MDLPAKSAVKNAWDVLQEVKPTTVWMLMQVVEIWAQLPHYTVQEDLSIPQSS